LVFLGVGRVKRLVVGSLGAGVLMVAAAAPVFAAQDQFPQYGAPNCLGMGTSFFASHGLTPSDVAAQYFPAGSNAGDVQQFAKSVNCGR
jgi:hypothetical protein